MLIYLNNFWVNLILNFLITILYICYCSCFVIVFFIYILSIFFLKLTKKSSILLNFFVGYYKIHPPLFYLLNHLIIYYLISKSNLKTNYMLFVSILTFSLGSLWALYQNIWGYYWSNDSIEYILLMMFLFVLIYSHQVYIKFPIYSFLFYVLILFLILLLRMGFIYTKHNFFKSLTDYDKYFMSIKLIFILNWFLLKKTIFNKKYFTNFNHFLFIFVFFCILFSALNNIYIIFITYTLFFLALVNASYLMSRFSYKNYYVHLLFFTFLFIYINYSIQYYTYYCQLPPHFNLQPDNDFKKHTFDVFLVNKNKSKTYLLDDDKNANKLLNINKIFSVKFSSLSQNIINYF